MAERSFPLPDLGEGLIEATILEWLVEPGQWVERNTPLVEVETTKSAVELPSPIAGTVRTLHGADGDTIAVGSPLITFDVADDEAGIVGQVPQGGTKERRVRLTKKS